MPDSLIRKETTHIDEVTRTASASTQWLLENRNRKGAETHPISHNNKLQFYICGEDGFAEIAKDIASARQSIDLVCWGFDPGMELVRTGATWPRGDTYGELLLAAARRGVQVRLLVWYDELGTRGTDNLPGISYGALFGLAGRGWKPDDVSPKRSQERAAAAWCADFPESLPAVQKLMQDGQFPALTASARADYCQRWYEAAFNSHEGAWNNIEVRKRGGNASDIKRNLQDEQFKPSDVTTAEFEEMGMKHIGTHHQKPILIDYMYEQGRKAVGYVMGLNSVTGYWDTAQHLLEDPRREQGKGTETESIQRSRCAHVAACEQASKCKTIAACMNVTDPASAEVGASKKAKFYPGFRSMIPYQDYACRISRGASLLCLYANFITAWERAGGKPRESATTPIDVLNGKASHAPPAAMKLPAVAGDSTVQIVRTQPQDNDKTIKELYMLAAAKAALATGYLYAENQYFQYEDWTRHLMETRKKVVAAWQAGSSKPGKSLRDMPVMHVFIVIPVPERPSMVPRTYDALAVLGQQNTMMGQAAMINDFNKNPMPSYDAMGAPTSGDAPLPAVVTHANTLPIPDLGALENTFGTKVSVAMLQTCGIDQERWRYREIYIHSKLLLVNDSFLTLGSANMNQRSMTVDSEINIATDDPAHAQDLRRRIFHQLTCGTVDCRSGSQVHIATAHKSWINLMKNNLKKKLARSQNAEDRKMTGFILALEDSRSSTTRLG